MRLLSFDQATKVTGWCACESGVYKDSGVIDLSKNTNTDERTKEMGLQICEIIKDHSPDMIVIEEVQFQTNVDALKKLARLQGIIIGFSNAHDIEVHIIEPSRWRKILGYRQGRGVSREELKEQSVAYVYEHFGFDYTEDRCEAICINIAAQELYK